ncbi:MAG: hypothetical protein ACLPYW_13655 [Acidimicrobiales bacterium]
MRTEIVPARDAGLDWREKRFKVRAIARVEMETDVGLARIEQAAALQVGRARAVVHVGKQAMQEIAFVSQVESQLCALVPMAAGRLQAIGDMTALQAAEIVGQTVRRVM